MEKYFNLTYEFDHDAVHRHIAKRLQEPGSDYICVADGVILNTAERDENYRRVVNNGMFCICDSSYVPLYIKWIYGKRFGQYSGSQIFEDVVRSRKYRMIFLGTQQPTLDGLQRTIAEWNPDVESMVFHELPFCKVEDFDYPAIAKMIEDDGADIVWVALGAPKQEQFMHLLKPHLKHGVAIAVGAVFKFFSGVQAKRAPKWMVDAHLEFAYRLTKEPKKQFKRCAEIVTTLPRILAAERRRKKQRGH